MFWTSFMLTDYHVLLHIYVPYGPHGWFSNGKIGIFHSPWGQQGHQLCLHHLRMQTYPCRPWEYPVKSGKFPSSAGKSFELRPKPCGTAKLCCGQLQICHLLTADFDVRRFDCKALCSASLRLRATFESVHRQPEAWRFPKTRQTDKANFNSLKQIRQIKEMQIIADTDSYIQLCTTGIATILDPERSFSGLKLLISFWSVNDAIFHVPADRPKCPGKMATLQLPATTVQVTRWTLVERANCRLWCREPAKAKGGSSLKMP